MPFDWREYLVLANILSSGMAGATEEAGGRSAVSRAYYAAFGYARRFARTHEQFQSTGGPEDHERLREHFREHGLRTIAQSLGRPRMWRNRCDYDDEVTQLGVMVNAATVTAQQVIDRL